jgi:hypothetical protein
MDGTKTDKSEDKHLAVILNRIRHSRECIEKETAYLAHMESVLDQYLRTHYPEALA